jgi:maltooligosyltrehalose trehalohydrolase
MQPIAVWAPAAGAVEVELIGTERRRLPMAADDTGWYRVDVPDDLVTEEGHVDYAFRLGTDDTPLPDPRSPWQPAGVHGPSRTFDPTTFAWTDASFIPADRDRTVIYELHVGTFTPEGTFTAAIGHLAEVAELGVTHVELMPVAAFAGHHGWGYDGVDLYAPHPAYGTPADLQALVDACHARGLAVLLDVVYNHLGPEGNYLSRFGPYFTDRYRTPWGDAVNLDGPGSDEVRRFFVDNATRWLRDFHIDGLRLDAMHAAVDTSAVPILEQLRHAVDEVATETGRRRLLIAEYEGNDPRVVWPLARGGYGLDAHWNDDVHHALHTGLTGETTSYYEDYAGFADLTACLHHGYAYAGRYSRHRQRTVGRFPEGVDGHALVACLQNHDQVGNRARGDRIGALAGPAAQKVGAALLLTAPFTPLLFMGEEWAASTPFPYFADHEGDLAEAVRRGRLAEFQAFGWDPAEVADPEDEATFAAARLRREEQGEPPHAEMRDWYRALLALRNGHPELRDPRFSEVAAAWDPDAGILVVRRGDLTVVAGPGAEPVDVPLKPGVDLRLLLASDPAVTVAGDTVHLVPMSVAVVAPAR